MTTAREWIQQKQWIQRNIKHVTKRRRRYYHRTRKKIVERNLQRMYGISLDDYNKALKDQKYRCALCRSLFSLKGSKRAKIVIDHCHRTGKFRGILHHSCNMILGFSKDDPKVLQQAIRYLKSNK